MMGEGDDGGERKRGCKTRKQNEQQQQKRKEKEGKPTRKEKVEKTW
jgi:hypothetical protein